jgi:molybdopterin converting factor small subunit
MNVQVNYFGKIAESLNMSNEIIPISDNLMPLNLRNFFEDRYPHLKESSYKIAVNQEFTEEIKSNVQISEIALLPPFAGG